MNSATYVDLEQLARVFQALADRKRLEIVRLLTSGERCVCDLTEVVGARQSLLSFHLKILRESGVLKNRRRGKWMYYSLNYEFLEEIRELLGIFSEEKKHQESCCCESLCRPAE